MFGRNGTHPCILFFPQTCNTLGILFICTNLMGSTPEHPHSVHQLERDHFSTPRRNAFLLPSAACCRKLRDEMPFTLALPNRFSSQYELFVSSTSKYSWVPTRGKCCGDVARRTVRASTTTILYVKFCYRQFGVVIRGQQEGEAWAFIL